MKNQTVKESAFFARNGSGFDDREKRFKARRKDDMREARKLYRMFGQLFSGGHVGKQPTKTYRGCLAEHKQNCIVKGRYGTTLAGHANYLEEYISQAKKDKVTEKPELFSAREAGGDFIEHYKETMVGRHYKVMTTGYAGGLMSSPKRAITAYGKTAVATRPL